IVLPRGVVNLSGTMLQAYRIKVRTDLSLRSLPCAKPPVENATKSTAADARARPGLAGLSVIAKPLRCPARLTSALAVVGESLVGWPVLPLCTGPGANRAPALRDRSPPSPPMPTVATVGAPRVIRSPRSSCPSHCAARERHRSMEIEA